MAVMVVAFGVGLLFSAGLAVSQMINPAVVLGFLDIAGDWNPTLVMVMAGGIVGAVPGFMLARRRQVPVLGGTFQVPTRRDLDARLIGGDLRHRLGACGHLTRSRHRRVVYRQVAVRAVRRRHAGGHGDP